MFKANSALAVFGSSLLMFSGITGAGSLSAEANPAPVLVAQGTQTVRMGSLQTFQAPNGFFSVGFPSNWDLSDLSDEGITRAVSVDPFGNAMFAVAAFETDQVFTPNQLGVFLQDDVEGVYGDRDAFEMEQDTVPQNDGSLRVFYTFVDVASTGETIPFMGNAFIEQRGDLILLTYFMVPDAQFEALQTQINEVLNSVSVSPAPSLK
ncbi:MAG: hypothetical protein ACFCU9_07755 [Cyanophyceae cyanobacterium]